MKKMLVIPMIALMLIMVATSVFATAESLAEKIYAKGSAYGVTVEHKNQMDRYFTNNPVTDEQENYVLTKADECIAIMDNAGVKDVTKLSETDLNSVKSKVQDAAKAIGLSVTFEGNYVKIWKNGKLVAQLLFNSNGKITSTSKFVYTGANTLVVATIGVAFVAVVAVAKARKNA